MKTSVLSAILISLSFYSFAQNTPEVVNKVNQGAQSINAANAAISNTSRAVDNTTSAVEGGIKSFKKIGSIISKKKKNGEAVEAAPAEAKAAPAKATSKKIVFSISAIDYGGLKKVEDHLTSIEAVTSVVKKFNTSTSTIEVEYSKEADDLWDALPDVIKNELELTELGDGKIVLQYIKKQ